MTKPTKIHIGVLATLLIIVFGHVLLSPATTVVSSFGTDLSDQFLYWGHFSGAELRQGNLPMWNPYTYGGQPWFSGLHSALLYPPNLLYVAFSAPVAANLYVVFHVALTGVFTDLWARRRGLSRSARVVAAVITMFSGATFLRVWAGHVTMLATIAWMPLVFASVDALIATPTRRDWSIGVAATAMTLLASYPQLAFYTAVTAALYTTTQIRRCPQPGRTAASLVAMGAVGFFIAAAQLVPGFVAGEQSIRGGGVSLEFASTFSFPIENLLTLIAPGFFGKETYWGRWYLWEANAFVGVTACVAAGFAVASKRARAELAVCAVLVVLAFGAYTPIYPLLFDVVPGFNRFRGAGKLIIGAVFLFAIAAATGVDALAKAESATLRRVGLVALTIAVVLGAAALILQLPSLRGGWRSWVESLGSGSDTFLKDDVFRSVGFAGRVARGAGASIGIAATTAAAIAAIAWASRRHPRARLGFAVLLVVELVAFARTSTPTFELAHAEPAELVQAVRDHAGDHRSMILDRGNLAMTVPARDVWGYNPLVLRRYAELMTWMQGLDPSGATYHLRIDKRHPLFAMLRFRYIFYPKQGGVGTSDLGPTLPIAFLVDRYQVAAGRDSVLAAIGTRAFDPRTSAVLESEPNPRPEPGASAGRVKILDSSTDHFEFEVDAPKAALLIVTENYAEGWNVEPVGSSSQTSYQVLPANHSLRAVPLAAGKHRLIMSFTPPGLKLGAALSGLGVAILLAIGLSARRARARG